eukprot:CAMPEP_0201480570 /NCGR_PEP_ID=MMETSP0151_2-20130828/5036_1 /ASSEMBLY_ACC=CAM_ASM_000257 /TAXON_ID=200890 /ORGANISM="Paramoeba atlantica, Strain 621/1 / CCAP 1560/9" /LENGTH=171 /DNA_ID=CAMNT_0047862471 /DNA_START=210 /DNA_END=721 /DNA_ORIENTATION=-
MWGAGGGAGGTDYVSKAGGGGFSQGRFNMTSSDSYTVFVGQGGEAGGKVSMRQGGGGGGGTALLLFDLILAAGAGGGGGTATDIIPGAGGGMAGTSASTSTDDFCERQAQEGEGATQSRPGAGGVSGRDPGVGDGKSGELNAGGDGGTTDGQYTSSAFGYGSGGMGGNDPG